MLTFYLIGVEIVFLRALTIFAWEIATKRRTEELLKIDIVMALIPSLLSWAYLFVLIMTKIFELIERRNNG